MAGLFSLITQIKEAIKEDMKAIKIDGSFPEWGTKQLAEAIAAGWQVYDKTVIGERYVLYLLRHDPDVGTTNEHPNQS